MSEKRSRRGLQIEQKTFEIIDRLQNDPRFLEEVRNNPAARLQEAGLPAIMIGPFLKVAGYPSLDAAGFTPRNDAEFEAAFMVQSSAHGDILHRILNSGVTSFGCPGPRGTGPTCQIQRPNTEQVILPPIYQREEGSLQHIRPGEVAPEQ